MRKLITFSLVFIVFINSGVAQLLMSQNFDALSNGSLSGQATWTTINANTLVINVASGSPITGCSGGGSKYVQPGTAATIANERLSYPTTNFVANTSQVFYLSFLMNISNAGSDANAHIISLGNDFGGTNYEFSRVHVQSSGGGYNIGISEGNGTGLGGNSGGGIAWGSAVLSLNQTYHFVLRYDYVNGGTANSDAIRIWANPGISSGSEPTTGSAQATIAAGTMGNDILFDGDNVRNVYLNYKNASSPVYRIDEVRYARGATSSAAWTNLGISGSCAALPLTWLAAGALLTQQSQPLINWKVEEVNVKYYVIERSFTGRDFTPVDSIASKGDGLHEYIYECNEFLNGPAWYRIKQVDIDGKNTYSSMLFLKGNIVKDIMIYPNPLNKIASLYVPNKELMNTAVYLCDMNGQILRKIMITKTITYIDMQPYASGTYFVKLKNGKNIRLMKE